MSNDHRMTKQLITLEYTEDSFLTGTRKMTSMVFFSNAYSRPIAVVIVGCLHISTHVEQWYVQMTRCTVLQ